MGLMNKLRDKTHIILIVLILAFLATIVFEWGMDYLGLSGGVITELGSVNGTEIKYTDFENQVNFAIEQQRQQTGEDLDETVISLIRDQVWEQMVSQILAEQQIKKLGIKVTNQEILNWVYNSPQTLPEPIKRNFVDSTGQFNMAVYQQALATKTPEVQKFWSQVEDYLRQTLLSQKLQSVITATVRVTEGEILQKFKDENISADFDYVFLDVNSVQDNQVQITEEDLKSYYEKNKENFKRDESVKLRYVLFPDIATMDDTIGTEKQLKALVKDLKKFNTADTTTWGVVNDYSLSKYEDKFFKPNEISSEVADFFFKAAKDSISDVIMASDGFHVVKLIDTKDGEDVFVNASHILINIGTDTIGAKLKSEQLVQRLKNGDDFVKLAAENSDDPGNKFKGGNLGWFTKGAMVKEFEEAVMGGSVGEIRGPVKTQFGYHIIKINDRQKKEFKFADIKIIVKASVRTRDAARKRAEDFAYVTQKGNFDEEAKKLNLPITEIPTYITKGSFVPGAGQNKSVNKFALDEKKGAISDPVKIQNGYAVYMIAEKIPAGYIPFEEIKATQLTAGVKIEKKLDLQKQTADALKNRVSGSLSTIKDLDTNIRVQSADSVSISKPNQLIGSDFDFNNIVFKMQAGQISDAIRTNRGYYIVQIKSITPFDQNKYQQEYENIKSGMLAQKKQTILQDWITELKEKAVIVDNRDKFYR